MRKQGKVKKNKRSHKGLFFLFSVTLSFLLIVGATYAWVTYSDEQVNRMVASDSKLKVQITGNTEPQVVSPNLTIEKNIQVQNVSETNNVFIRVSLKEVLLTFDIDTTDQTGNANLKDYSASNPSTTINNEDVSTWAIGAYYQETIKNRIYKGKQLISGDYKQGESGRDSVLKNNLLLSFSDHVLLDNPSNTDSVQDKYWLYADGYFYYSERVYVGNKTSVLLKDVKLKDNAPNEIKGGLYTIPIEAEGRLSNSTIFDIWSLSSNPSDATYKIYKMYQKQF